MPSSTPPENGPRPARVVVVAVVVALFATGLVARPDVATRALAPLPLERPLSSVVDDDPPPPPGACGAGPLTLRGPDPPWGPGETLAWDLTVFGVRAGGVGVEIGERVHSDGIDVFPVSARAHTDSIARVLGEVDATMISLVDARSSTPVRMANELVTRALFVDEPTITREDAAFAPALDGPGGPRGGRVNAVLDQRGGGRQTVRKARVSSRAEVVDLLGILPWLRARELPEGRRFCLDLFHRRRLFRVEAVVGPIEALELPIGPRRGRRIDARILRATGREPRELVVWLSNDDDRVLLRARTPEGVGDIELRLTRYVRGRRTQTKPQHAGPTPPAPSPPSPPAPSPPAPTGTAPPR